MIAIDTSSVARYLSGVDGPDIALVDRAILNGDAVLPSVVVTELLSNPAIRPLDEVAVREFNVLSLRDGYWAPRVC